MKKGRLSKREQAYIKKHHQTMPPSEIAAKLDRDPVSIENYIEKKLGEKEVEEKAGYNLKSRPFWEEIKKQFNNEELKMFIYHWGRIISQFRDDVLPTEELQITDAIKLEILMNRDLRQQRETIQSIEEITAIIQAEKQKDVIDQDRDYVLNLERQVAVYRAAIESLSKDYKDLQGKKGTMLKDLKATREQRIKRLEDSRETFTGWIKGVMENPAFRDELSISMEKMRIAVDKEYERLSTYHKYTDGLVDQPLLVPENVKDD